MNKLKDKIINFLKWLLIQVKDWHNLILLIIVAAALFAFCICFVAFGLFFIDGKIHLITAGGIALAFWMGPFTPFWPLCITITLCIRKFLDNVKKNDKNKK